MVDIRLLSSLLLCIRCSKVALHGNFSQKIDEDVCIETIWTSRGEQTFVDDIIYCYNERYSAHLAVDKTNNLTYTIAASSVGEYNDFIDKSHKQCELKTSPEEPDMKLFFYNEGSGSVSTLFQGSLIELERGTCQ
ncbi:hypothetical protein FOL47_008314 [Perkinsus chesapeaki]|uniref:Uncharacterized protein n=1 Tax=Perkinsus chesapeaki TaxID=330153 RepID=A0A7J6LEU4_PERCH|nr:hypothetical protein FOL47_008314 [Perkinsus chesapeaki]